MLRAIGGCLSWMIRGGGDDDDSEIAVSGSVSSVVKVSGTHEFTIRDYSRMKGMGIGRSVMSENFTVDGRSWYLAFYPDGYMQADAHFTALYLQTVRPQIGVARAEFSFDLVGGPNVGAASVYVRRSTRACKFDTFCNSWGIRRFISRQELESVALGAVRGDTITIRCTVTIHKGKRSTRADPRPGSVAVPPPPPSCHGENSMRFLATRKPPCDVCFNVDGVTLKAHRLVVAGQSGWFEGILYGHGREAGCDTVDIVGTSREAFAGVLHFIYNDELPPEASSGRSEYAYELTKELFVAADMYLLERMKRMCARRLCDFIRRPTAETILELAEAHACKELEQACRNYLARTGMRPLLLPQN